MIKKILFSTCMLFSLASPAQTTNDKYRSVYDSTGTIKAYYLTIDTARINNASLLPPGTAVPLFDEKEKQVGSYILNNVRTWVFTLNKKE